MNSQLKAAPGKEDFANAINRIRTRYESPVQHDYPFLSELVELSKKLDWAKYDPAILSFLENSDHRVGYCDFKSAIINALQIKSVCEIGIGLGISALTFAAANPAIKYTGIDNGENAVIYKHPLIQMVAKGLEGYGVNPEIYVLNSQEMSQLPHPVKFDLVYVDGDHSRQGCKHDVVMAWDSGSEWILVDDTHNTAVAAGVFDALFHVYNERLGRGGFIEWTAFPDTWTGNILIRNGGARTC